ncbi:unnamed protein product [Rotaria socialis]|uniref:UBA domain-containing protein n=1 Tax=Rotaria socialis TaxID=392032 RepID=A0A817SX68_9BILA|nr:unnamed protein product [Rotaria socialis]CAF3303247.1 unnamed protein product [Rotaria socialis]CAF3316146.1 unnamed protein product [Rotaria socialis]CAF4235052.1 unnamed protein product [Rotaria socialis]CAF4333396.1 unnamed protein product [Rotaria socialis]
MRGATSKMFNDHLHHVTLKIWYKTGLTFEETFPLEKTTFADVKCSAIRQFLINNNNNNNNNNSFSIYRRSSSNTNATSRYNSSHDDVDNYNLISISSKRMVDDEKTLGQQKVKDGDEYLLAAKHIIPYSKFEQSQSSYTIDAALIENRTQDLSQSSRLFNRDYRSAARTEFRTDLNRILITLIETSQKLLWCHPDAENIFKQAEEFLLRSPSDESNNPTTTAMNADSIETRRHQISKLVEMGFTEQQARIGLKRTKYDIQAATDLLLNQSDIGNDDDDDDDDGSDAENQSNRNNTSETVRTPLFSRNGCFVSVRKFRQQSFQPNAKAIQSLGEIGFARDDIVNALRMFNNDKNLACEYLLSDRQQQQNMNDAENEQGLDPNSSIFQSIMQNAIVQKTLNSPKTFFIMLQIAENPTSITNYLNDPEIGNMLLQISRIYHAEKENINPSVSNRSDSDHQEERLSRTTGSISGDFDDDSD